MKFFLQQKFKTVFLLLVLFFSLKTSAQAKDFSSFYKTTYEFQENGEAYVTQEVSLVNQNPNLYVSEYSLSLKGVEISQPEAYDKIGPVKIKIEKKDNTQIITLSFNEKVAGEGKILSFILKYRTKDLATKEGNLWQISIPKLSGKDEIEDFQVTLKIPQKYGKLAVTNPHPKESKVENNYFLLSFDKEEMVNYGVSVTLGQYQVYQFKISTNLENNNDSPTTWKIAIPPDTGYQTIYYQKIEPFPIDVKSDNDGNWFALYQLQAKEKLNIEIEGLAKIFPEPQKNKKAKISPNQLLSPTQFWASEDAKIKELANKLQTPEKIYQYVVENLDYDYQKAKNEAFERSGSLFALENPKKATCAEFTDLFIALCRAAGIPAREIVGYAKTENLTSTSSANLKILHSWPEYFDSKEEIWKAVDPTWENTTGGWDYFHNFDMNHLAFVIHGENDSSPLPPISYNEETKKITVNLSDIDFQNPSISYSIINVDPNPVFSFKTNFLKITFQNDSGFAIYNNSLTTNFPNLYPSKWQFEKILPFSKFEVNLSLRPKEILRDYQEELKFSLLGEETKANIIVKSLFLRLTIIFGTALSLILLLLLLSIKKTKKANNEKNN